MTSYPRDVLLLIGGTWRKASDGGALPIVNPATEEEIGSVAKATRADLDEALEAAAKAFAVWRKVSAYERAKILKKAADIIRSKKDEIGPILTMEQGKPLAEARTEVMTSADLLEWFAEESRRTYGRVIPGRADGVNNIVIKEPVGPVAAFTPWNFPMAQAVRKIGAALSAGCSIILKGPEETPASCAALVACIAEAGVTPGAVNLVYGVPAEISGYLVPHRIVRKISFTGSTAVGKQLAALAGLHMKRATMELGGHAPTVVFGDADIDAASRLIAAAKFRNAGQVCVSPTRIMVQDPVYDAFLEKFTAATRAVRVGNGLEQGNTMGALANGRRVDAMETLLADAKQHGGEITTGGKRIGNKGYFFEPTIVTGASKEARAMNEEPFGPVALISRFSEADEAIAEANRLPFGLGAFAYTRSTRTATMVANSIESGMVSINHHGMGLPELPFGGVKDSGYGSEGGLEAMEGYLVTKLVTQAGL
jgi:succinate-semialdehyde dehydrogenase/glutarate-semialdehyde dehydrogenase